MHLLIINNCLCFFISRVTDCYLFGIVFFTIKRNKNNDDDDDFYPWLSSLTISQLSMSEKLAKLAHKIGFLSDVRGQEEDIDKEDEEKSLVTFQPSLWPWDSVRENLR